MSLEKIKYTLNRLPKIDKILSLGGLLVVVSVVLPWYSDLDAWAVGNTYIALNGPLYLIGFFVLILGAISLLLVLNRHFIRRKLRLPTKESLIHLAGGTLIVFFLIIANSVFFHKDFGVNILRKETRFGMLAAFIGAILISFGGYLASKEEEKERLYYLEKEKRGPEPLINLNERYMGPNSRAEQKNNAHTEKNDDIKLKLNL